MNEPGSPDGVFLDPEGGAVSIKNQGDQIFMELNWRPLHGSAKPDPNNEIVNNVARIHHSTATFDRIATISMPHDAATGASGAYTSGPYGTQYICRWGKYLVALNWQSADATLTLPPDMTRGTGIDLVSGTTYDLSSTTQVPVPADGGVVLYEN
ncbi:MAG: hypothetical protein JO217_05415 [Acidobacteriaceae bacterium]|nr:hypothetical protein [Acidobacteriaceae bacterium]